MLTPKTGSGEGYPPGNDHIPPSKEAGKMNISSSIGGICDRSQEACEFNVDIG